MKRRICRICSLLMTAAMLTGMLAGCAGKNSEGNDGGEDESKATVIRLEDYGGAGDGVTDNGEAISLALSAAKRSKEPVIIEFEKDATYYFEKVPGEKSIFGMTGIKDATLKGDNTTISMNMERLDGYANIERCENIRIEGFNLKTSKSVYAIGTVLEANVEKLYIDVQSDRDLEITETYAGFSENAFGLPLTDYNRAHMYISSIDVLDAGAYKYRINLQDFDDVQRKMQSMVRDGLKFLFPRPEWGEVDAVGAGAFIMTNSTNVELEDINLWSAGGFCFHMRYNDGKILVRNVNITPEPGTDMVMSGWRDGFHLKDNPGQYIFEDCRIERNFDDAFNTGTSGIRISKVYSETELELYCGEFGGTYYGRVEPGDTLMIYDENNGSFVTYAKVKEYVNKDNWNEPKHIILEKPVPDLMEGLSASPIDAGQPDMIMKNCYINGSYRFRTPLTCENTEFATMYAWFDNIPQFEGPVAAHQHFTNCKFYRVAAPDPADSFCSPDYMMELGSVIKNWKNHRGVLKAEDIVFENCEIDPNLIMWKGGYDVTINGVKYTNP